MTTTRNLGIVVLVLFGTTSLLAQGFFPLEVGDTWFYNCMVNANFPTRQMSVLRDSVMPNGKQYGFVSDLFPTPYMRVDVDTVFIYSEVDQSEYVFLRRSSGPADTVAWIPYSGVHDPLVVMSVEMGPVERLGITWSGPTWTLALLDSQSVRQGSGTPFLIWTIQDSLGVVSTGNGLTGEMCSLNGALLSGITYGTTVGVFQETPDLPPLSPSVRSYPNPFNPSTNIEIWVPSTSEDVVLTFHDALGRKVDEHRLEVWSIGRAIFRWTPSQFAPGIYFVRIFAGGNTSIDKLIFLK